VPGQSKRLEKIVTDEPLEARIASVLSDTDVTSAALADLVIETEAAITAAHKAAEEARVRALDPVLSPDPKAARAAMEDAAFTRDRLRTLLPRLQRRYDKVKRREVKTAWDKQYDALAPRVGALAEELKAHYCKFVPKIADILARARELNQEVRRVRDTKPYPESGQGDDGRHLYEVELVARGYSDLGQQGLSLDRDLVLPDFAEPSKRVWPPHEVPWNVRYIESLRFPALPYQVEAAEKSWREHGAEVRAEQEARAKMARK
jgi:hypothetical protein